MISAERRMVGRDYLLGKESCILNFIEAWVFRLCDCRGGVEADGQTYTSQTGIKKGNRDMEVILRDLEYFATLAALRDPKYKYPKSVFASSLLWC
jgi:hypothetical protein